MESVNALNVFVQVAEKGSLVAAGRALGISASAVGKSISRLEERLKVRLLHRSTRSITLTAEGAVFLERCHRILAEIEAAESELFQAMDVPRGLLRVSLPHIGEPFVSVLSNFQRRYPEIDLDLDFSNRYVDLVREGFDAAVRSGPLTDSQLMARYVGAYRMVLVASPGYLGLRGLPAHPRDLADHDRLALRLPDTGKFMSISFVDPELQVFDRTARTPLVAGNSNVLLGFAERGHGLAYIADFLVHEQLANGTLRTVLDPYLAGGGQFHLVWAPGRHIPPKLRVFIDYAVKHLLPRGA